MLNIWPALCSIFLRPFRLAQGGFRGPGDFAPARNWHRSCLKRETRLQRGSPAPEARLRKAAWSSWDFPKFWITMTRQSLAVAGAAGLDIKGTEGLGQAAAEAVTSHQAKDAGLVDWVVVGRADDIPLRGARVVAAPGGDIAVFKAVDGAIFALRDRCPHKGGPLSQGIIHGHAVTCPLHNWVIGLASGEAQGADKGCTPTIPVRIEDDKILIPAAMLVPIAA